MSSLGRKYAGSPGATPMPKKDDMAPRAKLCWGRVPPTILLADLRARGRILRR
jgi:hypothetical protein